MSNSLEPEREEDLPDIQYGPVVNEPVCGKPVISRRRVVGGSGAGFGRFPWQALIRIGTSRCGLESKASSSWSLQ